MKKPGPWISRGWPLIIALLVLACGNGSGHASDGGATLRPDAGPVQGTPDGGPEQGTPDGGPEQGTPDGGPEQGTPDGGPEQGTPDGDGEVGVLDQGSSSLSITSDGALIADGHSTATIVLRLVDTGGNPMPGVQVDLVVSGEGNAVPSPPHTDEQGTLSVPFTSTRAETKTVSAVVHLASGLTPLLHQGSATFVPGPVDHLAFLPTPQVAVAGAPIGLAVALEDAAGNVTEDTRAVTVSLLGGGVLVTRPTGTLTRNAVAGVARFDDVALTAAATFSFVAAAGPLPEVISPPIDVIAAAPSTLTSSLALTSGGSTPAVSDDTGGITLRVSASDGYGNPCSGWPVWFETDGSQNLYMPEFGVTDASGQFAAILRSTKAEAKTISALVGGVKVGSVQVTFKAGPPDPLYSRITLSPATVVADGASTSTLTLRFRDRFDNPAPEDFWLTGDGVAQFGLQMYPWGYVWAKTIHLQTADWSTSVRSTQAGPLTITTPPEGAGITLSGVLSFLPGPPTQLIVTPGITRAYAGERLPSLSVQLADALGNPIPDATGGVSVSFDANPSGVTLSGTLTRPFVDGSATFDDLSFDHAGGGVQLGFTDGTFSGSTTAFDVAAFRSTGPWGGDVLSVAVGPASTIWAGTRGGGLFKSAVGLASWEPVHGLPDRTIEAILPLTLGGASQLLVGTPSGAYRSYDDGVTWVADTPALEVRGLAYRNNSTPQLLAATTSGVYAGSFSSSSWTFVDGGITEPDVRSVAMGAQSLAGTGSGRLFRSLDATTWSDVGFDFGAPVTGVAVGSAGYPRLFAGTDGAGLFWSTDNGVSWSKAALPSQDILDVTELSYGNLFALTRGEGLFWSNNYGATWTPSSTGLPPASLNGMASGAVTLLATSAGVFQSSNGGHNWSERNLGLANVPARRLLADPLSGSTWWVATGSVGVARSTDSGLTWVVRSQGLFGRDVSGLGFSPAGDVLFAATDQGVFRTTDGATTWYAASTGLAPRDLVDLAVGTDGTVFVASASSGVFTSKDGAASWDPANVGLGSLAVRALAVQGPAVYAATEGGVFKSLDDGATWSEANAGLTSTDATALVVDAAGQLDVGNANGTLFRSADGAATWTALTPVSGVVQAIAAGPGAGELEVGTSSGLWTSDDSGSSWTNVSAGLRSPDVLAIAPDPASQGRLLVGTRGAGVLRTSSRGR